MSGWELVGEVAVDSGTLIVVDPAYVDDDMAATADELIGPYDTPDDWQPKARLLERVGPGAQFVRLSAFGGDGTYPVSIRRDAAGMVVEARIVFDDSGAGEEDS